MPDATVALFPGPRSRTPCEHLPLTTLYEHIRIGTWADPVAVVRLAREAVDANTDPEAHDALEKAWKDAKALLPAVSLSCDGQTRAKAVPMEERGLVASGRLQVDIDLHGQAAEARDAIRERLLESPYLEALFLSPSGDGWKGVLRVEGAGEIDRHGAAAAAVEAHLQGLIGRGNDQAVKDVQRLCYVSHDPDLLHRPDAQVLRPDEDGWLAWAEERVQPPTPSTAAAPMPENPAEDAGTIPQGQRYTTLLRYAGWFRRCGMERGEIESSLQAINDRRCHPALPLEEVQQMARDIVGYAPDQITQATVENWAATTLGTGERRLAITCFADTEERQPDWLWPGYLLRGATAVVGGRQGTSKGLFTMDLAARLTRGDATPDGSPGCDPTNVLIVSREDDAALALKPRLRVAGADMARVFWSYGDFTDATPWLKPRCSSPAR
jgi:hypothetical protein